MAGRTRSRRRHGRGRDRREPQLRRGDELVEGNPDTVLQFLARGGLAEPLAQQGRNRGDRVRRILQGQEHAEDRGLEFGGPVEIGDPVVRESPAQLIVERLREPVAFDVEALQVGVEVLPRAVDVLDAHLVLGRTILAQLGEIGEHGDQFEFVGQRPPTGLDDRVPDRQIVVEQPRPIVRIDVVAE